MADPFRLKVMKALTTCLEAIVPALNNTYQSDLRPYVDDGGQTIHRVIRGREIFGESDPLPMISILEPPIPIDQLFARAADATDSKGDWEILIQGFVKDDKANPTDPAHILMADVKQALAKEKGRKAPGKHIADIFGMGDNGGKGNVITGMQIGPGVVRPPGELSAFAFFWLTLTLQIHEDIEQPFV